ncbi:MAG: DNA primase [Succinivibrio sp.]|nr:DNA primase [Succinivibrio sp.]
MPKINRSFISDRLLPAVSIESLIGQYCSDLKKKGSNYMCCCPFHQEKTPSFCVTPSKQMYYCFGCHEHGNALDFLMKIRNLNFVEAVEELARFAGVEVEYDGSADNSAYTDRYKRYYELMDRCAVFFSRTLFAPQGRKGLEYFQHKRGLNKQTLMANRLGYAPEGWDVLRTEVAHNAEEYALLQELGLVVKKEDGRSFSMFRDRVMIPILDKRGRVISFGGRTLGPEEPKYLNTKETPIYHKRKELFGLYEALRDNNNRPSRFVIVEGYMDVISLRQAGCTYAVASLGTATTEEQLQTLLRYAHKIVCCYDGDKAGRNAAWHALQTVTPLLKDDTEIRFAFLPNATKVDPDSLVREQGLDAFEAYLEQSLSYPEFLVQHTAEQYNRSDPAELSQFMAKALQLIAAIPLKPLQAVTLKILSQYCDIDTLQLNEMLKTQAVPSQESASAQSEPEDLALYSKSAPEEKSILNTPMRKLMAFALQQPVVVAAIYQDFRLDYMLRLCEQLKLRGSSELAEVFHLIRDNPKITPAAFIEITRDTPKEKLYRTLIDAKLNLRSEQYLQQDEQQRWLFLRIASFAQTLTEVLSQPFVQRIEELKHTEDAQENYAELLQLSSKFKQDKLPHF